MSTGRAPIATTSSKNEFPVLTDFGACPRVELSPPILTSEYHKGQEEPTGETISKGRERDEGNAGQGWYDDVQEHMTEGMEELVSRRLC